MEVGDDYVAEGEVIAERRDGDRLFIDRALEVVRSFILERGLMLYGGMAIDCSLKAAGAAGIYPDDARPDYDVRSADSVRDAYDLVDILVAKGFERVGAIRAIHAQTMRVRVNFVAVADISFTPREVLDKIPTLEYDGLRVTHPHWQRLDQHLAFCFPFANPPMEDLHHRFPKDLKRFNLLAAAYPLPEATAPRSRRAAQRRPIRLHAESSAVHGFAAFELAQRALQSLEKNAPFGTAGVRRDGEFLEFDGPPRTVVLATFSPEAYPKKTAACAPLLDVRPPIQEIGGVGGCVQLYCVANRLLATCTLAEVDGLPLRIVSLQYLLLYFLLGWLLHDCEVHLEHYHLTMDMISRAEVALADAPDEVVAASPFCLSVGAMGDRNLSEARLIMYAGTFAGVDSAPPAWLAPLLPDLSLLPKNYHPPKKRPEPTYDSPLFQQNGQRTKIEAGDL